VRLPALQRDFFQFGYVVRSVEAAIGTMRDRLRVKNWQVRDLPATAPARRLAFAYLQDTMLELVEVAPDESTIYGAWVPEREEELRLHHLGYLVDGEAEWRVRLEAFADGGIGTALTGVTPAMHWHYADTVALLGHYVETVHLTGEAGRAYWAEVPRN
jgi:hypothetical protein